MMTAAELLTNALDNRGRTQKELAKFLHAKTVTLHKRIAQNGLKAQEFMDAAEYLGYKVMLVDAETSAEMKVTHKGVGPRTRRRIDGVVYDTGKANALCHTNPENGWWMELYEKDGQYFAAHYSEWDGVDDFITLCPADEAQKLVEEYGE